MYIYVVRRPDRAASSAKCTAKSIVHYRNGDCSALPNQHAERAVLPITGVLTKNPSFLSRLFGASSTVELGSIFTGLIEDASVRGVVLDVDSPGGEVAGIEALSNLIFAARGKKPVIAVIDGAGASAASARRKAASGW